MKNKSLKNLVFVKFFCAVAITAAAHGCSDGTNGTGNTSNSSNNGGGGNGGTEIPDAGIGGNGGDLFADGGIGGDAGGDTCAESAKLIYVFAASGNDGNGNFLPARLFSLEPLTKKFSFVGNLGMGFGLTPVAITIVRDGISAYVSDAAHKLWRVNLSDGTPDSQPLLDFVAAGGKSSDNYTVAFVGDGTGNDVLYAEGYSRNFYKVDLVNKMLTPITMMDRLCDLTGTNDGRLFGFCDDTTIREFDPKTGATISSNPAPDWKSTWAIAAWGGYFWLFFGDMMMPSQLYRYDPVAKQSMLWMTSAELGGIRVPGAGVSTCAPLTVPK